MVILKDSTFPDDPNETVASPSLKTLRFFFPSRLHVQSNFEDMSTPLKFSAALIVAPRIVTPRMGHRAE